MRRFWVGFKRSINLVVIASLCWWLMVWIVGSFQEHRALSFDELIPTADKWLATWDQETRK
jgi:hypothetical protein